MFMKKLGIMKKVPVRSVWQNEARDFTPWLANEENVQHLSEVLGIEMFNIQTEMGVGSFSVDILAEDERGEKIIVENQYSKTDHDHLGKLITYASGFDAKYIVWIVEKARQEHEQAIDWLNENTTEDANFFLVEIELWQIGDSLPAPKFNLIANPNEWAKTVKQTSKGNQELSDTKLKQQAFFEALKEYGEDGSKYVKSWQKAQPQHWYNITIGTSKANLAATVNTRENRVGMELYIHDDKDLFHRLESKRDAIEPELGYKLDWQALDGKKGARIIATHEGNFLDEEVRQELIEWLHGQAENFTRVFKKRLV